MYTNFIHVFVPKHIFFFWKIKEFHSTQFHDKYGIWINIFFYSKKRTLVTNFETIILKYGYKMDTIQYKLEVLSLPNPRVNTA